MISEEERALSEARRMEWTHLSEAKRRYEEWIDLPMETESQNQLVGTAHFRLAMIHSDQGEWEQAKAKLERLASLSLTVPASTIEPGFGTWSEQGAYQAAICAYQINPQAGIRQMTEFIREFPESPLAQAAFKRISKWTGGKVPPLAEANYRYSQEVLAEQRRKASACGPKALAYVLALHGVSVEWELLMKECKTDETGTDAWSLSEAARRRGVSCTGMEVNVEGFKKLTPPFIIWSMDGHFQVIEESERGYWVVYDPQTEKRQPISLSALPSNWRSIVLVFNNDVPLSSRDVPAGKAIIKEPSPTLEGEETINDTK